MNNNISDLIFYTTNDGNIKIDVVYEDDTFWLNQKQLAELFSVQVPAITKHIKNILEDGELTEATISKMEIVQAEGKRNVKRIVDFYNLDMVIAVGYRVNSKEATQFRIWATKVLTEYLIKGFAMDDERLKQGKKFGKDYFDEQLERIREIRASERRFYQKLTDIYKECSIDYKQNDEVTQTFYKTVQNKLHFAITGNTAPEIIHSRVDADKANMGLTSWKNSPKGKILKSDITVAKNYLNEDEIDELNRIVTMYLDFAELQAKRGVLMKMQDWVIKLDAFLTFNSYELLQDLGKVSKKVADTLAASEYDKFRVKQDREYLSDFDQELVQLKKSK